MHQELFVHAFNSIHILFKKQPNIDNLLRNLFELNIKLFGCFCRKTISKFKEILDKMKLYLL